MSRYTNGWLTTFVAAYSHRKSDPGVPAEVQAVGNGSAVVRLAVAVVACEGEASDDLEAKCEEARLEDALHELNTFDDYKEELKSAGEYARALACQQPAVVPGGVRFAPDTKPWLPHHRDR